MVILKNPLLSAFEKVVDCKTMHAAAEKLKLSQAAVTKRIQLLESELKVTLFLRSRRGVSLTEEGKALYHYCRMIQDAEGSFRAMIGHGSSPHEVNVTVAGPTSFVSSRLAEACEPLYEKHPFLRLHLRAEDHANRVEMVRRGEADLAIVPRAEVPNEMRSKTLKPDRYLLVACAQWKGRRLEELLRNERIVDFDDADSTTSNYLKAHGLDSLPKRGRIFSNQNAVLIRYFIRGLGFGTLTEAVAAPYLESGDLIALNQSKAYEDALALVWYHRSHQMEYFNDIVRAIR